jgi:hypothetical protein
VDGAARAFSGVLGCYLLLSLLAVRLYSRLVDWYLMLTWHSFRWRDPHEFVKPHLNQSKHLGIWLTRIIGAEVKNPHKRVPQSMVMSVLINGGLSFAFIICVLFTIGDLEAALQTPTGYPMIEILAQATKSNAATTILMLFLVFSGLVALFGTLASVSRLVWAFARDRGLPFSDTFAYVSITGILLHLQLTDPNDIGASHPSNPAKCPLSRYNNRCVIDSYQHWQHDCILRHPLSQHASPLHLLYYPNPVFHLSKTPWRRHSLRPIPTWPVRPAYQHFCYRLWHLYCHLLAVPAHSPSHGAKHELWWPCHGLRYPGCHCGLVHYGQKEIQGPYSTRAAGDGGSERNQCVVLGYDLLEP